MPYLTGKENPFSQKPLEEPQLPLSSMPPPPPPPSPPPLRSPLNGYRNPAAVWEIGSRAPRTFRTVSPTGGRRKTRRRQPKKRTRKNKKKYF